MTTFEAVYPKVKEFLLTRPSRDVTLFGTIEQLTAGFLLTRPSRDVTSAAPESLPVLRFLLTRPSRDVTIYQLADEYIQTISTHTSLAGRDHLCPQTTAHHQYFYSHVPRGT